MLHPHSGALQFIMQAQQLQQAVTPTEKFLLSQSTLLSHRTLLSLRENLYESKKQNTGNMLFSKLSH